MYKRILVPFDGSGAARAGLEHAFRLGKAEGAKLRIMHVVNDMILASPFAPGEFDAGRYAQAVIEGMRQHGRQLLEEAVAAGRKHGIEPETRLVDALGCPAGDAIVREAKDWPADIIVMGTHGRRGLRRIVMGSDAEHVLRNANVPVLLVRAPDEEKAAKR